MSNSTLVEVEHQIQENWSPIFTKQLRGSLLLGTLVNKDYKGSIGPGGNKVTVSQINAPTGQLRTIGVDGDVFTSEKVSTSYVEITANKRAVASYTFDDVVDLQSQLSQNNPEVMEALNYAMNEQINTYLYSLVAASQSAPDHNIPSITDFNAAQLSGARLLAATAKWRREPGWYCIVDPSYMSDIQNAATLTSADYNGGDPVVVSGQIATKRFGFNILEDNNMRSTTGATVVDHALLFHPDFMHMVMQTEARIKLSDTHVLGQFGIKMSVDLIFGAALGIDGAKKHIQVYNSAW